MLAKCAGEESALDYSITHLLSLCFPTSTFPLLPRLGQSSGGYHPPLLDKVSFDQFSCIAVEVFSIFLQLKVYSDGGKG